MSPSSSSLSKGITQACQPESGEVRQVRKGSQKKVCQQTSYHCEQLRFTSGELEDGVKHGSSKLSHSRGKGLGIYPPTSTNCWVRTAPEKHEFADILVWTGKVNLGVQRKPPSKKTEGLTIGRA